MAKLRPEEIAFNDKVAQRIKDLRVKVNPNQKKFSESHDIDRQIVSRWESTTDERGVSIHTINRFCKMINITLKEFFDSEHFTKE
ncbi:helix-turn-helix domain-containing protein [Tamlana sp. I1]|uniref:helix-turn-helix domain-containing protein n=1 Tax=Tamlana sp. I1 TaxID=2762061 RepID=UPI00188F79AD|nr:helix-turn-helix transcriptional regulator [Tamlana sp. I1]